MRFIVSKVPLYQSSFQWARLGTARPAVLRRSSEREKDMKRRERARARERERDREGESEKEEERESAQTRERERARERTRERQRTTARERERAGERGLVLLPLVAAVVVFARAHVEPDMGEVFDQNRVELLFVLINSMMVD